MANSVESFSCKMAEKEGKVQFMLNKLSFSISAFHWLGEVYDKCRRQIKPLLLTVSFSENEEPTIGQRV